MSNETNPNAEILRAFAANQGKTKEDIRHEKAAAERKAMLEQLYAMQKAHELNMKRIEALESAAAKRRRAKSPSTATGAK